MDDAAIRKQEGGGRLAWSKSKVKAKAKANSRHCLVMQLRLKWKG